MGFSLEAGVQGISIDGIWSSWWFRFILSLPSLQFFFFFSFSSQGFMTVGSNDLLFIYVAHGCEVIFLLVLCCLVQELLLIFHD